MCARLTPCAAECSVLLEGAPVTLTQQAPPAPQPCSCSQPSQPQATFAPPPTPKATLPAPKATLAAPQTTLAAPQVPPSQESRLMLCGYFYRAGLVTPGVSPCTGRCHRRRQHPADAPLPQLLAAAADDGDAPPGRGLPTSQPPLHCPAARRARPSFRPCQGRLSPGPLAFAGYHAGNYSDSRSVLCLQPQRAITSSWLAAVVPQPCRAPG